MSWEFITDTSWLEHWSYLVILAGYLSLLLELSFFHVPSVASGVNIIRKKQSVVEVYSKKFRKVFQGTFWQRIVLTTLPLLILYGVFAWPFLVMLEYVSPTLNNNLFFIWLGVVFILAGRFITFASVLIIRRQNQQKDDSFRLHTDFLFARSRNPGLVGMFIFMFGVWLVMPSLMFLLGLVYYVAYMHFKVLMEEDFLAQKFGEPYLKYKTTTGRYFG